MSETFTREVNDGMRAVAKGLKGSQKRYEEKRDAFVAQVEAGSAGFATSWDLSGLLAAEVEAEVEGILIPDEDSKTDMDHRIRWFMDAVETNMDAMIRGDSGSSSKLTNLVKDIENMVKLGIYKRLARTSQNRGDWF